MTNRVKPEGERSPEPVNDTPRTRYIRLISTTLFTGYRYAPNIAPPNNIPTPQATSTKLTWNIFPEKWFKVIKGNSTLMGMIHNVDNIENKNRNFRPF